MTRLETAKQLTAITIGTAIYALGLNAFNIANRLVDGGLPGLSVLGKLVLDIDPGLTILVLNLPLLAWAFYALGWRSTWLSAYGVFALGSWLWVFDSLRLPLGDPLLAAVYAGLAIGLGLGLVFRYGGTTGGIDILVRVLNKRYGLSVGVGMFWSDAAVLVLSALVLDVRQVMYSLIAVFISGRLLDLVETGAYRAKALLVFSTLPEDVAEAVMQELGRGVSILKAKGAYSRQDREALYIVCSHGEIMRMKSLIGDIDPQAFIAIHDVNEVIGSNFTRPGSSATPGDRAV